MLRRAVRLLRTKKSRLGFTLTEFLVVVIIIGIGTTFASSSWFSALGRWEVTNVQQNVYLAIQRTQMKAQQNKTNWQFSIHETLDGYVEWASHAQDVLPTVWQSIGTKDIDIDLADTTLDKSSGNYYVRFNYKGRLASRTRTLAFVSSKVPKVKRCLVMSTLLGKVRLAKENPKPNSSGRYCY